MTWAPGLTLDKIEKEAILSAYNFYNKNIHITARSLKIDVDELRIKFNKYDKEKLDNERRIEDRKKVEEEYRMRARGVSPSLPINNMRQSYEQESINLPMDLLDQEIKSQSKKMSYTKKPEHKIDGR